VTGIACISKRRKYFLALNVYRQRPLLLLAEAVSRQCQALASTKVKCWELWCFEYVAGTKVDIYCIRAEF